MKIKRGDFGYIKAKKKKSLTGVLCMAAIGIAIFLTGLFLNKMSNRNIFTVIAVLFALPGAKFLVAYIVTFPFQSVSSERYSRAEEALPDKMSLYTDLVITSQEKVMNLDFVAVGNRQVLGLVNEKEKELAYIRNYLTKGVQNWGNGYKVKIMDSEKLFLNELARVEFCEVDEEEEQTVKSYVTSLIV